MLSSVCTIDMSPSQNVWEPRFPLIVKTAIASDSHRP